MYSTQLNKIVEERRAKFEPKYAKLPEFFDLPAAGSSLDLLKLVDTDAGGAASYIMSLIRMEADKMARSTFNRAKHILPIYCDVIEDMDTQYDRISNLVPGLPDFDGPILGDNCALSLIEVSHSFIEEFGSYSLSSTETVAPSLEAAKIYYKSHVAKSGHKKINYRDVAASYPRGKNSGIPIVVSGGDRLLNDVLMFHNMICGSIISKQLADPSVSAQEFQFFLDEVRRISEAMYGPLMFLIFDRYQTNAKQIPFRIDGQVLSSKNYEPRRRVINAAVKFVSMANKPLIKAVTSFDLSIGAYSQDRPFIRNHMIHTLSTGGWVKAIDQSRFDLRSGYAVLEAGLELLCYDASELLNIDPLKALALNKFEAHMPCVMIHDSQAYVGPGEAKVSSGMSSTSRVGSRITKLMDMAVTQHSLGLSDKELASYYLKYEPSLILGDDLAKLFPVPEHGERYIASMDVINKQYNCLLELEEPTKFIGDFIDEQNAKDPWKSSVASKVKKIYVPERFKTPEAVPLVVYTKIMDIKKDYSGTNTSNLYNEFKHCYEFVGNHHPWISKIHKEAFNSLPNTFDDLNSLADKMLKHPEEYGLTNNFSGIDEILNAFCHGLEFDADLSRIGLGYLKELHDVMSIESTMKIEDITKLINDILNKESVLKKIKNSERSKAYLNMIKGYNELSNIDEPIEQLLAAFNLINDNSKALGIRWQKGEYGYSFRFSNQRETRRKAKMLDSIIEGTMSDSGVPIIADESK